MLCAFIHEGKLGLAPEFCLRVTSRRRRPRKDRGKGERGIEEEELIVFVLSILVAVSISYLWGPRGTQTCFSAGVTFPLLLAAET